ncbi:MAG TPA: hypothetical protein VI455_12515 [Terriglobia bacterium]
MDDCRRYEGITPEKLEQLKQRMLDSGIQPPEGDGGLVEAMGVKVSVSYLAVEQALSVCIVERPVFIPASLVWAQLEAPLKVRSDS